MAPDGTPADSAFSRRLATHFARAAVASMLAAPVLCVDFAQAAIQHRVFNLPVPASTAGLYLNIETGASAGSAAAVPGWDINPYGPSSLVFYNAVGTGMLRAPGATSGSAANLQSGELIGGLGSFGSGVVAFGGASGQWQLSAVNLFGFRFVASDGLLRYGWGRMQVGASALDRTLLDIAWEDQPGAPIAAGADGSVPPTYNPCASTNPALSAGANLVPLDQSTSFNFDLRGSSCNFILRHTNVFRFVAPVSGPTMVSTCASGADTRLAVLAGCTEQASVIACNDNACGLSASTSFNAVEGTTYYIAVGAALAKTALPSPMSVTVTPPALPACMNAQLLRFGSNSFDNTSSAGSIAVRSSAAGATATMHRPLWFRFTPAVTGHYTFSTCGGEGDTVLALGDACPGAGLRFEALAWNDDGCFCGSGCSGALSSILGQSNSGIPLTQPLQAGTTYILGLGSFAAGSVVRGAITVDGPPQPPSNPADLTGDGLVSGADLTVLLSQWGLSGPADLNGDGVVSSYDITILLSAWDW